MEILYAEAQGLSDKDELDIFIGVRNPLADPYILYLRFEDLIGLGKYVYFFSYSMGRKKVILWGTYNKVKDKFNVKSHCKYNPNSLIKITKVWKERGFTYSSNSVVDRIKSKINSYLEISKPLIVSQEDYRNYKYIIAYYNGILTESQLVKYTYPEILDDFEKLVNKQLGISPYNDYYDINFDEFLSFIEEQVRSYEKGINRSDSDSGLLAKLKGSLNQSLQHINDRFTKFIEKSKYSYLNVMKGMEDCPSLAECKYNHGDKACGVYDYGTFTLHDDELGDYSLHNLL